MIGQYLRRCSKAELSWAQSARHWQRQGAEVVHTTPFPQSNLLTFRADSGWEGMVDLYAWFASMMPEHAGLASSAFSWAQLETLFFNCERPLEIGLAEFTYHRLSKLERIIDEQTPQPLYGLKTAQGVVWLMGLGDNSNNSSIFRQAFPLDYLPLPLSFELGSSKCPLSVVNKLRCGDVLLVTELKQQVTLLGKHLGIYQYNGNEIMIEEELLTPSFEGEDEHLLNESGTDTDVTHLSPRSHLPVNLTFTLQQATVTVQDLEALCQGHVFYCDPDAEKKVIIKGNGLTLARGELIWVEDRLGVEITELYHEAGNGK
ncbi:FliM/FliN family flagellar motor switch protein [Serratia liquefaciens]|uniref:FliM/FliN family flagellar motor switch protein n=1 Tax=Serratia liquefaciens TaxID=614 RepID=UPI002157DCA7|nr:FliM/FliN family flagellar motor switch protein [Serratia liquefaciens]